MSDYFPAEIHIGGPIRLRHVDDLITEMAQQNLSLHGYGNPAATKATLRQALQEGTIIHLYDDEARNGCFEELEEFLVRRRIHFDRLSAAFCEYSGEKVFYRGRGQPLVRLADQAGKVVIGVEELAAILDQKNRSDSDRLKALRRFINPPECTALTPIQFRKE